MKKTISFFASFCFFFMTGTAVLAQPYKPDGFRVAGIVNSSNSPENVTSPCTASPLPASEGFNDLILPDCWTQTKLIGDLALEFVASGYSPETTPQEGTGFVFWNSNAYNGDETRLVSPPVETTGISNVGLEFYWFYDNNFPGDGDSVYIEFSTDGVVWTTVEWIPRYDNLLTGWNLRSLTLPEEADNQPTLYVGFRFHAGYGNNCSLDNVVITTVLSPATFTAAAVSATQVNLSAIANSNNDNIIVVYNTDGNFSIPVDGVAPGNAGDAFAGGMILYKGHAASSINHTGLAPNQTVYYKAYSFDGADVYSHGSAANATTQCVAVTLPLSEGFNDYSQPLCWTQTHVVGNSDLDFVDYSSDPETEPQEGNSYIYWNSYDFNFGNETRLVSPPIVTTGTGSVDVSFYWMVDPSSEGGYNDGVYVEYSTDGISWTTVGAMIPQYDPDYTGWDFKTITLPSEAGNQPALFVGFRFYSEYGFNCSMDNIVVSAGLSIVWTGTTDTDWNTSANWSSNAVPQSSDNVIIPDVSNNPVVNEEGGTPASCNNLTIEDGAVLTIATGKALTINGILTNNEGTPGLVVNPSGSLIESTPGVAATVASDISSGTDVWHFFISPVTESIQASSASYFNTAFLDRYDEPSGEWVRLVTNDFVLPESGYSINFPTGVQSLIFTGTLKSGPVTFNNLGYTFGAPGYLAGWNLVGNPYPCGIDPALCSFTGDLNAFAYVWNGSNYNTYSIGSFDFPSMIPSLQGFFVRTTSGTNSLALENAAKTHGAFIKNSNIIQEMLKLSVNGNGHSDEAFVRFRETATTGFDQAFDAYKLFGIEAAPQLYSLLAEDRAAINTLPATGSNSDVSLGFKAGAENTYTLTVTGIESFDVANELLLEDVKTNTTLDLRQNNIYSFSAAPGDMEHRFNLHFKKANGVGEVPGSMVGIYSIHHSVFINNPGALQGSIDLYDITGRQLNSSKLSGKLLDNVEMLNYTGILLVKVITSKGISTEKIFIN